MEVPALQATTMKMDRKIITILYMCVNPQFLQYSFSSTPSGSTSVNLRVKRLKGFLLNYYMQ